MGFTVNLVQVKQKNRKSKKKPVYLRLYKDANVKYLNTGIYLEPKYWNDNKKKVRTSHRRHKVYNEELTRLRGFAEEKALELRRENNLDLERLKGILEGGGGKDLIGYVKDFRQKMESEGNYWAHRKLKPLIGDIEHFLDGHSPTLQSVNAKLLEDFQQYLLSDKKRGKPNSPNTVRRKMGRLKRIFNEARKNEIITHEPFRKVEMVKTTTSSRVSLTFDQIRAIENLELPAGDDLWHIRNYFLYSFYNAGIRFSDLCALEWSNIIDGRLQYDMRKTGRPKSIRQQEPMLNILDHYRGRESGINDFIFPILDNNTRYTENSIRKKISSNNVIANRGLKEIAARAGIETNVSFHVSRHTWANYAKRQGMSLYQISMALGHSDIKTTEIYMEGFDEQHLDEGMGKLYND